MNPQVKQRAVGAVVLVAVAVIAIPALLPGPPEDGGDDSDAPVALNPGVGADRDGFSSRIEPLAEPSPMVGGRVRERGASPGRQARGTAPARRAGPRSATGWVVQLGSFSETPNALALRDRLKAQGHSAFVESVASGNERRTRVLIGPEIDRDAALVARERLRRTTGLEGLVVPYPPPE